MKSANAPTLGPAFSDLAELLRSREGSLEPIPAKAADRTHAAVSLILREKDELEVLLIKRAEAEGVHGSVGLLGGRHRKSPSVWLGGWFG